MSSPVQYRVRLADLHRHTFEVHCRLAAPSTDQCFTLPSWIPGSYLLREFARHVVGIRAESKANPVDIEKIGKGMWRCPGAWDEVTVIMTVFALDESVRGASLDNNRGYFNGPCLFLCPQGRDSEPVEVLLEAPEDSRCARWNVATAMSALDVDARGFGLYRAESYEELIDHPVEISAFAAIDFEAAAIPHQLIVAGRHETDLARVAADLSQLCEAQIDFFGRPPPFERYKFLGLAVGDGYGGLEHRASCSLIFSRDDLPKAGETGMPRDYQRFLSLCSHEYFHTWNVKGMRPAAFTPYHLDRRDHTRLLWVFEGITSYYQDLFLLRSDLIGVEAYLQRLGELLSRVYRAPGRFRQSLAEASFDAWDKHYKPGPNTYNATISYYTKGALVALALDLVLRKATGSAMTLDRVMAELWRRFGHGSGMEEAEFEAIAQEFSGVELEEFFAQAVRGTEDLLLGELLAEFGVTLGFRAAAGPDDRGGAPPGGAGEEELTLGIQYRGREGGLEIINVIDGGPAERAGLSPGDWLIALDGLKITATNLRKRLGRYEEGERIPATVFRGDQLLEYPLALSKAPTDTCYLTLAEDADPARLRLREAWLGR